MAIVFNNNGTYWTYLGRRDGRTVRASTEISVNAPTAAQRKENKKAAEAIAVRKRNEFRLEKHGLTMEPEAQAPTFGVFALDWEQQWGILQRGYAGRVQYIVKELAEEFGRFRLDEISPEVVHKYRLKLLEKGTKPRTINRRTDVLKSILAKGVPRYYLDSPIARMKRLKAADAVIPTLNPDDEKKILAELTGEDKAIFLIALDSLVRLGDVLSLRWQDVLADGVLRLVEPKNGRQHLVPLSPRAQEALSAVVPTNPSPEARVFPEATRTDSEKQWSESYADRFERACKKTGVPYGRKTGGITFHGATRHTGATRLIEAGTNVRVVQEIGGWRTMQMLTRYTHPNMDTLRAAVSKIGEGR